MQACLEQNADAVAEQKSACADPWIINNHFVGIIKGAEDAGQLEQVGAENVWAQVGEHEIQGPGEGHYFPSESDFLLCFRGAGLRKIRVVGRICLAENAVDSGDCVEQVRSIFSHENT